MIYSGLSVSGGIAIGTAVLYDTELKSGTIEPAGQVCDPDRERQRLTTAVAAAETQLSQLVTRLQKENQQEEADILHTQLYLLKDPELTGAAEQAVIGKGLTAEQALAETVRETAAQFEAMGDDPYLKERAGDIEDVGRRVLKLLSGRKTEQQLSDLPPDSIIVAETLGPSDTAQVDRQHTAALITERGGKTSHTAILARNMGLPAVAGVDGITKKIQNGDTVIVDGTEGTVIVSPTGEQMSVYQKKIRNYKQWKDGLKKTAYTPCRTKDGRRIMLAANIGSPADIDTALENGAEAVGLFRTEFLYLERNGAPGEDEQFEIYRAAAEKMGDKPVIIRTLDIGGDKEIPYLHLPKEDNPFLGTRAIRLCFAKPELFKTQLRALLRAAVYGNLKIMFPMVASVNDIEMAKNFLKECAGELAAEKKPFKADIKTGIMIEIPAAAVIAADLAAHCDFFSIGTNDLVQYTLAVDRTNEALAGLYDPFHPAVQTLIRNTIQAAHTAGIDCGMCGEFASNEKAIPLLMEYGLDEFSVSCSALPETRAAVENACRFPGRG